MKFCIRSHQLSLRFDTIVSLLRPGRTLFDLCCDHGLIGFAALTHSPRVIFVDQSPQALKAVYERAATLEPHDRERIEIIESPGELLGIAGYGEADFIIAGVGITTVVSLISALFPEHLGRHRLILAPQQSTIPLRWYLQERGFGLIEEKVVKERGRFREILVIEAEGLPIPEHYRAEKDELDREYKAWLAKYLHSIAEAKEKANRS